LKDIVNSYEGHGKKVGIYSNRNNWINIFGGDKNCASFTNLPVWYAHYDNNPSFSDWPNYTFGGWTKPSIKQYKGTTSFCGASVDLNYYP